MFDFLKKNKTRGLHIIQEPQQELKLTVRQRALNTFSNIEGLDDVKEMMLRALESPERAHTLLIGPPACAKSLFMLEIQNGMQFEVYFTKGAATTKAGLQNFIAENPHKEIIIIDEIDKMSVQHQEGLLTMMERGEFTTTKVRNTQTVKANMVIFATSNSTERLSKPLLSRFTVFEIPEYTYEEFEAISVRIINKLPQNTIIQIASSVWKTGSKDIRDVLKIAKLCNPSDSEQDINRLISIHQKYRKTGKEYN
ncbi:MAG TPA: AAA family ATPase [Nitrososphaeraceae archaeon]|nr:AAA family ATPase [Nitrososphaeraceae archaeon]